MTTCRSCGAPIRWARTPAGKNIPLDAGDDGEPVEYEGGGLVQVGWAGPFRVVESRPGEPGYRTHFASCGQAKEWRK